MAIFKEKHLKEICKDILISQEQRKIAFLWLEKLNQNNHDTITFLQNFTSLILNNILQLNISSSFENFTSSKYYHGTLKYPLDVELLVENAFFSENTPSYSAQSPSQIKTKLTNNLWNTLKISACQFGIATDGRFFLLMVYGFGKYKTQFLDFTDIVHDEDNFKIFIGIFTLTTQSGKKRMQVLLNKAILEEQKKQRKFYHLIHETRIMLKDEFAKTCEIPKENVSRLANTFLNRILLFFFMDNYENVNKTRSSADLQHLISKKWKQSQNSTLFFQSLLKMFKLQDKQHTFLKNNREFSILKISYSLPKSIKVFDNNPLIQKLVSISLYFYQEKITLHQLGTLFEQSFEIFTTNIKKNNQFRKDSGSFYTPEYVTDFLTRKTIVPYLSKKNTETIEQLIAEHENDIETLQNKIDSIKILDNACGAGAFLIKATEILAIIEEQIEKFKKSPKKEQRKQNYDQINTDLEYNQLSPYCFYELKNFSHLNKSNIYSNNIFGVDLNQKAIEFAKLSIFLDLKMTRGCNSDWNNNLKSGNSLFDQDEGFIKSSFDWEQNFPSIVESGGFDVIIGNPPYIDIKKLSSEESQYIFQKYSTSHNRMNLYSTFIERGLQLLKSTGYFGYIIPNSILYNSSYKLIRSKLLDSTEICKIIKMPDNVFADARVETILLIFNKSHKKDTECEVVIFPREIPLNHIAPSFAKKHFFMNTERWSHNKLDTNKKSKEKSTSHQDTAPFLLIDNLTQTLLEKIERNSPLLGISSTNYDAICEISLGITPYDKYCGHTKEQIQKKVFHSPTKINDEYKPLIKGGDIVPYGVFWSGDQFIRYGPWLGAKREERFFKSKHLVIRQILSGNPPHILTGLVENQALYNTQVAFNLILKSQKHFQYEYLLGLLNSDLLTFYHKNKFLDTTKILFQKILIQNAKKLPIRMTSKVFQDNLIHVSKELIKWTQKIYELKLEYWTSMQSRILLKRITPKMLKFPSITIETLLKEVEKNAIKSLSIQQEQLLIQDLNNFGIQFNLYYDKICQLRKQSNGIVYEIYGLTKKEINLIEEDLSVI
ncbi:Eco57I restriction-modification methylase domain-containing protein [Candidatus Lokiarchaeum ossiferum]|uniref:Eco57I restriction-modification methylase domain-containing protein n=1 Tax=Candidatus Lokiarchaeum ossiferum TaxID=2951803 RepID=UPI00352EEAAE